MERGYLRLRFRKTLPAAREAIGPDCELMVDAGGSDAYWPHNYKWALNLGSLKSYMAQRLQACEQADTVQVAVTPVQPYYIVVDAPPATSAGAFGLTVQCTKQ